VAAIGLKYSFFVLGFGALIWLVPWLMAFPSRANTADYQGSGRSEFHLGRVDRNLLGLSLGHIGYGYYFYLMVTWLPSYVVQARHLPLRTAGACAFVPYLVFALGEPIGGWIADRLVAMGWSEVFSRKLVITVAYLSSILLLPAGLSASITSTVCLLGCASLVGLSTGNIFALVQRFAPDGEVGFSTGFLNLAGNLSGVIAPLATGFLVAQTGSYLPAFAVAVTVLLLALPTYWWVVRN
jgi:ACS family D-galactonate transporter-like MFS transporter